MTPIRSRRWLVVASLLLPLLVLAQGSPSSIADSGAAAQITFETTAPYYDPVLAIVPARSPVRWINATASHHTVRHDGCLTQEGCAFQSIAVPPDSILMIAPLPPGRYPYHCELHPVMRGTLIVTEQGAGEDGRVSFADAGRSVTQTLFHKEDSR